jgi:hypothetical protein
LLLLESDAFEELLPVGVTVLLFEMVVAFPLLLLVFVVDVVDVTPPLVEGCN